MDFLLSIFSRKTLFAAVVSVVLALTGTTGGMSADALRLHGRVESNGAGLRSYQVSLYAGFIGGHVPDWQLLGVATSDHAGNFRITYSLPSLPTDQFQPLLFAEAVSGPVMLASAIGSANHLPQHVVINERTTVATGNAFAQFVNGWSIEGNPYGMSNAIRMAANLADPNTGNVGKVLALSPNGKKTSTLATFNSLSNAVASCVAVASNCTKLFEATTPSGGPAPTNVLQAVANIVKYPSYLARMVRWRRMIRCSIYPNSEKSTAPF